MCGDECNAREEGVETVRISVMREGSFRYRSCAWSHASVSAPSRNPVKHSRRRGGLRWQNKEDRWRDEKDNVRSKCWDPIVHETDGSVILSSVKTDGASAAMKESVEI